MSILSTTKSGYEYYKWRDEIKWFAIRVLNVVNDGDLKEKENVQIEYRLPWADDNTMRTSFTFKPTIYFHFLQFLHLLLLHCKDTKKNTYKNGVIYN